MIIKLEPVNDDNREAVLALSVREDQPFVASNKTSLRQAEETEKEPMTVILYGTEGTYVVESSKELMPFCFVSESLKGVKN